MLCGEGFLRSIKATQYMCWITFDEISLILCNWLPSESVQNTPPKWQNLAAQNAPSKSKDVAVYFAMPVVIYKCQKFFQSR